MGSPACEHTVCTTHSPPYHSHLSPYSMAAWLDKAEDVKPPRNWLGFSELGWPWTLIPCDDRLTNEENSWVLRTTEGPAPPPHPHPPTFRTPGQNAPPPTQTQQSPSEVEGQMEERCLEQVQSMVVGEVMKDVDTACKLLNIAPGRTEYRTACVGRSCSQIK